MGVMVFGVAVVMAALPCLASDADPADAEAEALISRASIYGLLQAPKKN